MLAGAMLIVVLILGYMILDLQKQVHRHLRVQNRINRGHTEKFKLLRDEIQQTDDGIEDFGTSLARTLGNLVRTLGLEARETMEEDGVVNLVFEKPKRKRKTTKKK